MEEKTGIFSTGNVVFEEARSMIRCDGTSCVVIRGGEIIHTADGRGVSPLLMLYNTDKEMLRESCVVDRIIGKAAAMILVLGGTDAVYGDIMSIAAQTYLSARGILFEYGELVESITDRTGAGLCPIERSVLEIDDPEAGLAAMTNRIAEMQSAAGV